LPREVRGCSAREDGAEVAVGDTREDPRELLGQLSRRRDGSGDSPLGRPLDRREGADAEPQLADGHAPLFQARAHFVGQQ
jgi:hypothetical protein